MTFGEIRSTAITSTIKVQQSPHWGCRVAVHSLPYWRRVSLGVQPTCNSYFTKSARTIMLQVHWQASLWPLLYLHILGNAGYLLFQPLPLALHHFPMVPTIPIHSLAHSDTNTLYRCLNFTPSEEAAFYKTGQRFDTKPDNKSTKDRETSKKFRKSFHHLKSFI